MILTEILALAAVSSLWAPSLAPAIEVIDSGADLELCWVDTAQVRAPEFLDASSGTLALDVRFTLMGICSDVELQTWVSDLGHSVDAQHPVVTADAYEATLSIELPAGWTTDRGAISGVLIVAPAAGTPVEFGFVTMLRHRHSDQWVWIDSFQGNDVQVGAWNYGGDDTVIDLSCAQTCIRGNEYVAESRTQTINLAASSLAIASVEMPACSHATVVGCATRSVDESVAVDSNVAAALLDRGHQVPGHLAPGSAEAQSAAQALPHDLLAAILRGGRAQGGPSGAHANIPDGDNDLNKARVESDGFLEAEVGLAFGDMPASWGLSSSIFEAPESASLEDQVLTGPAGVPAPAGLSTPTDRLDAAIGTAANNLWGQINGSLGAPGRASSTNPAYSGVAAASWVAGFVLEKIVETTVSTMQMLGQANDGKVVTQTCYTTDCSAEINEATSSYDPKRDGGLYRHCSGKTSSTGNTKMCTGDRGARNRMKECAKKPSCNKCMNAGGCKDKDTDKDTDKDKDKDEDKDKDKDKDDDKEKPAPPPDPPKDDCKNKGGKACKKAADPAYCADQQDCDDTGQGVDDLGANAGPSLAPTVAILGCGGGQNVRTVEDTPCQNEDVTLSESTVRTLDCRAHCQAARCSDRCDESTRAELKGHRSHNTAGPDVAPELE